MSDTAPSSEATFKRTSDGWVFAPSAAILGPWVASRFGNQYLVDDVQKASIAARLAGMRHAIKTICLVYAVLCGLAAVAMLGLLVAYLLLPSLPRLPSLPPVPGGIMTFLALFLLPFAIIAGWHALAMRRMLAGLPRASARITYKDYLAQEAAALSVKQIRLQLGLCLMFAGLFVAQLGQSIARGYGSWIMWSALLVMVGVTAMHWFKVRKLKRDMDAVARSDA